MRPVFVCVLFILTFLFISTSMAFTRTPLLEEFTSPTEPLAEPADDAFTSCITTYPNTLATIAYHMNTPGSGSPWYTAENTTRKYFYGQSTIPAGYVDGEFKTYTQWTSTIASEQTLGSPIIITINLLNFPGTTQLYATVSCDSAMTGTTHHLYAAIVEDKLVYTSTGREYQRVTRYINENGAGKEFSVSPGGSYAYHVEIPIPSPWVDINLWAVSWVQDWDGSHHVENAQTASFMSFGWIPGVEPTSLGNIKAVYRQ